AGGLGVIMFFFFSSRRRHTRFDCDWSSDVCSSDLVLFGCQHSRITNRIVMTMKGAKWRLDFCALRLANFSFKSASPITEAIPPRSEERRVGKECRSRRAQEPVKKKGIQVNGAGGEI